MSGFSFNFEDRDAKVLKFTTQNQRWLDDIERRIAGVKAQVLVEKCDVTEEVAESEVARLEAAYKDVKKRMSKEEFVEYKQISEANRPKAYTKEEQAAITKQMESNRDRPSH